LIAPLTVSLAREALRAGLVDVLWWPFTGDEFDRATWGLVRLNAEALLERVWRTCGVLPGPVSVAMRVLSDPSSPVYQEVYRLARASGVSPRALRLACSERGLPWTPKVMVDWAIWLRVVALLVATRGTRSRGLYALVSTLEVKERKLNRVALRRTGLPFLESVEEPGLLASLARFEAEWREVLAHG